MKEGAELGVSYQWYKNYVHTKSQLCVCVCVCFRIDLFF